MFADPAAHAACRYSRRELEMLIHSPDLPYKVDLSQGAFANHTAIELKAAIEELGAT